MVRFIKVEEPYLKMRQGKNVSHFGIVTPQDKCKRQHIDFGWRATGLGRDWNGEPQHS